MPAWRRHDQPIRDLPIASKGAPGNGEPLLSLRKGTPAARGCYNGGCDPPGEPPLPVITFITPLRNLLLILLFGVLSARPAAAVEEALGLSELAMLARVGAPQLALRHLDAQQPAYAENPVTWMSLERERVYLLRTLGDVDTVIERLAALPPDVSVDFRRWAHTELGFRPAGTTAPRRSPGVLRDLLWNAADAEMDTLMRWRRMVIQAYLLDAELEDARSALVRYQQDFGAGGREWNQLRLRVLLQTERYEEMLALSTETEDAMGSGITAGGPLAQREAGGRGGAPGGTPDCAGPGYRPGDPRPGLAAGGGGGAGLAVVAVYRHPGTGPGTAT
jgi:hypothetical protein